MCDRGVTFFSLDSTIKTLPTESTCGKWKHAHNHSYKMPPKKKAGDKKDNTEDAQARIAIVNTDRCRPKKCHQECKKSCPVVKLGKLCIEVDGKSKLAFISEPLCIGTYDDE